MLVGANSLNHPLWLDGRVPGWVLLTTICAQDAVVRLVHVLQINRLQVEIVDRVQVRDVHPDSNRGHNAYMSISTVVTCSCLPRW